MKIEKEMYKENQNQNLNNYQKEIECKKKYIKLQPKIDNKRNKSAENTVKIYKYENYSNPKNNKNLNDYKIMNTNFLNINNLNDEILINPKDKEGKVPMINFEINNNFINPNNFNFNKVNNDAIENATNIRRINEYKKNLQLEVPDNKNYVLTSTDIVNYGTKTNQSKPINDLKNVFNNNNSNLNNILNSANKNDGNDYNTLESITRKFMFSCENNFNEIQCEKPLNSIENETKIKDNIDAKFFNNLDNFKSQKLINQHSQVLKSSVDHVEIDIFNTDISISRISTNTKENNKYISHNNPLKDNNIKIVNQDVIGNHKNIYNNENEIDVGVSASKSSIQLFPVNEKTDGDLNFNMEVFTNDKKKIKIPNPNNFKKDNSQYTNSNNRDNKKAQKIYNKNNNNNTNQTDTIYQNINTNTSRDADTINRINTEGTINNFDNTTYNPQKSIQNSIDNSEILQAFSEKNNKQNQSTAININNIPEIKNNRNLNENINFNREKNFQTNDKNNFIFQNNSELASISGINRNEISPIFNKNENNPRNITNLSNINQNNQSINFSKFTNFVGNSNISNQNITNNLTHINNNINQNNISNFKNFKKNNIPKILSGNNYYQNIINNTANKSSTTNISNKNMVQSYLSTERNDRIPKNNSNEQKKLIDENNDLNYIKKSEYICYDNTEINKTNDIKPLVNLSMSCDEKDNEKIHLNKNDKCNFLKFNNQNIQKFINVNEDQLNDINKHNYFDSDKLIFTSKANSKNEKVFNFNKDKIDGFITNKDLNNYYNNNNKNSDGPVRTRQDRENNLLFNLDDSDVYSQNISNLNNDNQKKETLGKRIEHNTNYNPIDNYIEIEDQACSNNFINNNKNIEKNENLFIKQKENEKLINPNYNNFKLNIFEKLNKNPFLPNNDIYIKQNLNINIINPNKIIEEKIENNNFLKDNNNNKILAKNNSVKSINNQMESKKSFETKSINSQERYAGVNTDENKKNVSSNINYLNINSLELNKKKFNLNKNKEKHIIKDDEKNLIGTQENIYLNFVDKNNDDHVCYNAIINLDESEMPSNMNTNREMNFFKESTINKNNILSNKIPSNENFMNKQEKFTSVSNELKNKIKNKEQNFIKKEKLNAIKIKNNNENKRDKKSNFINQNSNLRIKNDINKQRSHSKNINVNKKLINKNDFLNPKNHKSLNLPQKKSNKQNIGGNILNRNSNNNLNKDSNNPNENKKFHTITLPDKDEILFNKFHTSPENNFEEDTLMNSFNQEFEHILDDEKFYKTKNDSCDFSYSCKSMKNDLNNLEKLSMNNSPSHKNYQKNYCVDKPNQNEMINRSKTNTNNEDFVNNNILTENSKNSKHNNYLKAQNYDTTKFSIEVKNSENLNRLKTEEKDDKIKLETVQEMNNVISKSVKLQRISQENCQMKIKNFLDRLQTKQENQEKVILNEMKDLNFTETSLIKSGNSSFRNEVEQDLDNFLKKISPTEHK